MYILPSKFPASKTFDGPKAECCLIRFSGSLRASLMVKTGLIQFLYFTCTNFAAIAASCCVRATTRPSDCPA